MATEHLLYRGDTPAALADALVRLTAHARTGDDTFTFGPLALAHLVRDGLQITGEHLDSVKSLLAQVPGLAAVDH